MKKSTTYEKKSSTKQAKIAKRPVQGIEIKFKDLSKTVKDFILGTNENLDKKDKL